MKTSVVSDQRSTISGQQSAVSDERMPNPAVLQAILTRLEEFEREQTFLVRHTLPAEQVRS
jgi:hypothetical protein